MRERLNKKLPVLPISMNVSRVHLRDKQIINYIKKLELEYEVDPKYLELELTENIYIEKNKLYYRYDESMKNKKAFIFNSNGQLVSVYVLSEESYSLDALSPGVYYIKIQNGQTFKFVKK